MRILINAISVKEGGSLVVLSQLLKEMVKLRPDHQWYAVIDPVAEKSLPQHSSLQPIIYKWAGRSPIHLLFWYEITLPRLLKDLSVDLVFSQTNYLPLSNMTCPTLLLVQHAGHFSSVFLALLTQQKPRGLERLTWKYKSAWVRKSIRQCTMLTVQTETLAKQIIEDTKIQSQKIITIPHGTGLVLSGGPKQYPEEKIWHIGYISKYGIQKNFSTLFEAVKVLHKQGCNLRLAITLDQDRQEFNKVKSLIDTYDIAALVDNYNELTGEKINSLYGSLDIFVFPSLCESFGFPMVEAMAHGLPVIAADTPGNREIAGNAALYFQARNADELTEEIKRLINDGEIYADYAKYSVERAKLFSWRKAAEQTINCIEQMTHENKHRDRDKQRQQQTEQHYDQYPLDFMTDEDEAQIEQIQPLPFRHFVTQYLAKDSFIADIGCGPGRATLYLEQKNFKVCAVDLSMNSLLLAKKRAPRSHFVQSTNMALPFRDQCFNAVVSDGVIHHTPEPARAFQENARILKQGGVLYLGVYKRNRYYYYIYNYIGKPVRRLEKNKLGRFIMEILLLPLYYLVHLFKSGNRRTWQGAKNFFYDYFITPQASFHTKEEIEQIGRQNKLELLEYDPNMGNVHCFIFKKR